MLVTVLMREAETPGSTLSSSCRRHDVKGLGRIWIKKLCWPGGKYAEHSRRRLVFGVVVGEPRLAKIDAFVRLYRPRGRSRVNEQKRKKKRALCKVWQTTTLWVLRRTLECDRMLYFWVADRFS
jgi:hypothetical protein